MLPASLNTLRRGCRVGAPRVLRLYSSTRQLPRSVIPRYKTVLTPEYQKNGVSPSRFYSLEAAEAAAVSDSGELDAVLANVDASKLLHAQGQNAAVKDSNSRDDEFDAITRSVLKRKFGHEEFRHEQAAAIRAICRGENALVVFPTGAGKSLCYQIPALAFEELDAAGLTGKNPGKASKGPGITIVVSPLISLMKDQVDALLRRGISAACLDSSKSDSEKGRIYNSMRDGNLRLLYCSPERLTSEGFIKRLESVPGGLRLLAIDEAHCISEWGPSFKPSYLKLARFVNEVEVERVICLTATATTHVAESIRKAFHIGESNVFRTAVYRPNLHLHVEVMEKPEEKRSWLLRFVEDHAGSTIVYVAAQHDTLEVAEFLAEHGHSAAPFHAGLDNEIKMETQDAFMKGEIRIVVATIAFGMGIDKPDVRNIVHYIIPNTIEEYSQQVGRAGRDGKPSFCVTFVCEEDFWLRETFARRNMAPLHLIRELLRDVFLSPSLFELDHDRKGLALDVERLGHEHHLRPDLIHVLLAFIELRYGLIRALTSEYRNQEPPSYNITWDFKERVGFFKRRYLREYLRFEVLKTLPSTEEEVNKIAETLYAEMADREKHGTNRLTAVRELLSGEQCLAQAMSDYFGMELPEGKSKCGHCTFCLTGKRTRLPSNEPSTQKGMAWTSEIMKTCRILGDDPRSLAHFAFGMLTPQILQLSLHRRDEFGSMKDYDFEWLLKRFTKLCNRARDPNYQTSPQRPEKRWKKRSSAQKELLDAKPGWRVSFLDSKDATSMRN